MNAQHRLRRIHPTVPNILEHAYANILAVRNVLKEGLDFVFHMGVEDVVHIQVVIREQETIDFVPDMEEDVDVILKAVTNQLLEEHSSVPLTVEEEDVRWKIVTNVLNLGLSSA